MKKRWYALPHFWGLIAAFAVLIPGLLYLLISYDRITGLLLERNIKESERHFHTVTLSLGRYVETYFDVYVNTPEILGLLKKAKYGFTVEKDIARVELFRKLFPLYKRMQNHGLRQLHFHTPDSRSFLRFHEPYRFGDTLTDVRPAVVKVNQILQSVSGFESGKSLSGYRYIYPILDNGDHLGSVEFGISFEEIRENIAQGYEKTEVLVLINKSNYLKLFEESKRLYTTFPISPNWMLEDLDRELYSATKSSMEILMKIKSKPIFLEKIESGKRGAVQVEYNNREYGVVNLPVYDLSGNLTASVLYFGESSELTLVKKVYLFKTVGILTFAIFIGLLIFSNRTRRNKTKELEMFNLKLAETVFVGIYCLDKKGNLIFINEKALEMIGYDRPELINGNVHNMIHKNETSLDKCPIYNVTKTGKPYFGEEVFMNKTGNLLPVKVSAAPLVINGENIGSVVVFNDITFENKRKEEQLKLLERAEDAERIKSNFIKMISYQINTPISVIMMSAHILKNHLENKNFAQYSDIIEKSALNLLTIAQHINEVEYIQELVLKPKCFSLKRLIDEYERKYTLLCERKGLVFLKVTDDSLPRFIEADEIRLGQLIDCILDNAVNFTEKGYIKFSVQTESKNERTLKLHFSMEDTGVGIHDIHLKTIMDPYVKVDLSKNGVGAGLFIFKKILEKINGSFDIQSKKAVGTVVNFHIDTPIAHEWCPVEEDSSSIRFNNFSMLLAYDNSVICQILMDNIKIMGGRVVLAETSSEMLSLLGDNIFDIVMIKGEFLMSEKIITILSESVNNPPVIALWDNRESSKKYHETLDIVKLHLDLPLDFKIIIDSIITCLPSEKKVLAKSFETDRNNEGFDTLVKTFGDKDTVLNILKIYVKDMSIQFEQFKKLSTTMDRCEIKKVLHRIKGASLNVNAFKIAELAQNAIKDIDYGDSEIFGNYYKSIISCFEDFKTSMEIFKAPQGYNLKNID